MARRTVPTATTATAPASSRRLLLEAVQLHQSGRLDEADARYRAIIDAGDNADALHLLGVIQHQRGRQDEAAALIGRAIARAPGVAAFHNNLGLALLAAGNAEVAAASFRRAIGLDRRLAEAHSNLGNALMALRRTEEAVAAYEAALTVRPDYPEALSNLGSALHKVNRLEAAEAALRRAIALRPGYAGALANLAVVLREQDRLDDALGIAEAAIAADQTHASAHVNRAVLLLQLGRWVEGWEEYEWRWRLAGFTTPKRAFERPEWDGASLDGRSILLHAEQGLGSAIQFVRFAPLVAARGGRVILECQPLLSRLFTQALAGPGGPVTCVITKGESFPPFDTHAPLMSLPRLLAVRLDTLPSGVPYLAAEADAVECWRRRLAPFPGPRVGLAWAGNREHSNDHNRSLPAAALAPLIAGGNASFFALQVGAPAADLAALPAGLIEDLAPAFDDFAATAACVGALDLVISVDTAVAHLAAALGRPTWLLTTPVPEWRWLYGRDDSPWYPTLRIWRQRRLGDWPELIERVAAALAERPSFPVGSG